LLNGSSADILLSEGFILTLLQYHGRPSLKIHIHKEKTMKRHASMNRIYRLIWSQVLNAWVAVAENSKGRGKRSGRKLVAACLTLSTALAHASPIGGQVTAGTGSISQPGSTTTITQSTQNLSLNWQSFNIAPNETTNFVQPSTISIAVNRILDINGSQILGHLNANGQVWLINPNGILFGQGVQVNVGGLVASTLDIASNSNGVVHFAGNGTGSIVNQGVINATNGGYIAFIANTVSNTGTITAPMGAAGLAAGNAVTLTFADNSLVHMQVDGSLLNSLAQNGGIIQADGGMVILTAGARDTLLASVVNNTGIIEARTVENHNGTITLLGGMSAGTVNVDGTLDASAPVRINPDLQPTALLGRGAGGEGAAGANGGSIETSAAHVTVADGAKITTLAANGMNGTWLIDPANINVVAAGFDASTLNTVSTFAGVGATPPNDSNLDVALINNAVSNVVLQATNNISFNTAVNIAGGGIGLTAQAGNNIAWGANTITTNGGAVNFIANDAGGTATGAGSISGTGAITTAGGFVSLSAMGATSTINVGAINTSTAAGAGAATVTMSAGKDIALTGLIDVGAAGTAIGLNFGQAGAVGALNLSAAGALTGTVTATGGAGSDTIIAGNGANTWNVTGANSGTLNAINFTSVENLTGGSGTDVFTIHAGAANAGTLSGAIVGGTGTNTLIDAGAAGNTWTVTGADAGTVTGVTGGFTQIGSLTGGSGNDSFTLAGGTLSGAIIGGLVGVNTLTGDNITNTWAITGGDMGTVTGVTGGFSQVGNLIGGSGNDTFIRGAAGGLSWGLAGGSGVDTYDVSALGPNSWTTTNAVDAGIEVFVGNGANTTLIGNDAGQTFNITGSNAGTAGSLAFSGVGNLTGGSGNDTFVFANAGTLSGSVAGGGQAADTLNLSAKMGAVAIEQQLATATGIAGTFSGIGVVVGNGANTTITGVNAGQTFNITGANAGTVGSLAFTGAGNMTGGAGNDFFTLSGGSLTGVMNGAGGADTLSGTTAGPVNFAGGGSSLTIAALSAGSVGVGGVDSINVTGAVNTGVGAVNLASTGAIGEGLSGTITAGLLTTNSNGGTTLNNANRVSSFSAVNTGTGNIQFTNTASLLSITGITNLAANGNDMIMNTGDIAVNGAIAEGTNNLTLQSGSNGAAKSGNIGVNNNISWSANTLTLNAASNINFNSAINGTGTAKLALLYGQGAINAGNTSTYSFGLTGSGFAGQINLPAGPNFSTKLGFDSAVVNYLVITALGSPGSTTGTDLQGMNGNLSGNYALGSNIDACLTGGTCTLPSAAWNGGAGFTLIGNYSGSFDGLGHTISNLTITLPSTSYVGLFGYTNTGSIIQNVGLVGYSVNGNWRVGGLMGQNGGTVSNSYAIGSANGQDYVGGLAGANNGLVDNSFASGNVSQNHWYDGGGLVGLNHGTISNSYSTGNVSGVNDDGGLVGLSTGIVSNSYATGNVSGTGTWISGLVGNNYGGSISNSYASGNVSGASYVGGLVGTNYLGGTISNSYASGSVNGTGSSIGGLVGINDNSGVIGNSSATGSVNGATDVGGLVGANNGMVSGSYGAGTVTGNGTYISNIGGLIGFNRGTVDSSYAMGSVSSTNAGNFDVGGLVGRNYGTVSNSYSKGSVTGVNHVGGLVAHNTGTVSNSYSTGGVTGIYYVGGLMGYNYGTISNSYATGSVTGGVNSSGIGGLLGYNIGGMVSKSYSTGNVSGATEVGGLVGINTGTISDSYATDSVTGTSNIGGLVGSNSGTVSNSHYNIDTATINGVSQVVTAYGIYNAQFLDWLNHGMALNIANYYTKDGAGFYQIDTLQSLKDLLGFADNAAYKFRLTANLDLATLPGFNIPLFSASQFDGAGHILDHLSIDQPFNSNIGFIGTLGAGSTVNNLGLANCSVGGTGNVGGLAGINSGMINNSYDTGSVTSGSASAGGLVGYNAGTVSNSYATSNVTGGGPVFGAGFGGLVGDNTGKISGSYATGNVTGGNGGYNFFAGGGLVGYNSGGTVINSYATGNVSNMGNAASAGLVGYNGGSVSNSYSTGSAHSCSTANPCNGNGLIGYGNAAVNSFWDMTTSGLLSSASGTGLTTAQALTQASYTGFDFANTWYMVNGSTRPFLRMEYSTSIRNAHQLQLMGMNRTANYTLANNLDLAAELTSPSGMWGTQSATVATGITTGFAPIGNYSGTFDGLGHTISNLSINLPTTAYVGLFGYTSTGSLIQNIGLLGGSVVGQYSIGELVGNNGGTVSNSYATGSVTGGTYSYSVGGLVGFNAGTINNSYSTGSVTGTGDIGGLVGNNGGWIITSYATGNVSGNNEIGGLVGTNDSNPPPGAMIVGGVISNSYATGDVSGTNIIGGLAGGNFGTISNSYSTGNVSGMTDFSGLVGVNYGILNNSFYNVDAVTINSGHQLTQGGLYNTQYTNWFTHNKTLNIADYASTLPSLGGGYYGVSSIQSMKDMLGFSESNSSFSFRLNSNIDLSGAPGLYIPYFSGVFDGAGHVISNLDVNLPYVFEVGMFGFVATPSTVKNLGVENAIVTGFGSVGGLVGGNSGTISNSYTTGSVSGTYRVGGLAGYNNGTISNSYSTGSVNGYNAVGGLVGYNAGTISDTYSAGSVTGATNAGGLVGYNWYADVRQVLPDGRFLYDYSITNLGTISNSFWDTQTSDQATSAGGIGLSTAQMQQQANFMSSTAANGNVNPAWDFSSTWVMYSGHTYPLLQSFMLPLTVTANNANKNYDGQAYSGGNGVTYSDTPNLANLFGTVSYGGNSQGAINAGSYAITPSGLYSNQQGYIITCSDGNLTVNSAPLSVTANAAGKTYDGLAYSGGNGVVYSGFVNGETNAVLGGALAYGGSSQGAVNAGSYFITPNGLTSGNYTIDYLNGTLTVNPATLTYIATPASFIAGQTPYGLTGIVNGFVSGDNKANATNGNIVWATTADPANPPGQYSINGSGLLATNYVFTQDSGNATALRLNPATPSKPAVTPPLPSDVLSSLMNSHPATFNLSPTILVIPISSKALAGEALPDESVKVAVNSIGLGVTLYIVDGGLKLPDDQY
jgi:filamentous hemagglutinin family protein